MRVMVTFTAILATVLLLGWLLVLWITPEPCEDPIDGFIGRQASAGSAGGSGPGSGGCTHTYIVGEDGAYHDTHIRGWAFDIPSDELTEHGVVTEAVLGVHRLADATAWSVRGVDPADFLVLRSAEGDFFFVVSDRIDEAPETDIVLCRYATGSEHRMRESCGQIVPMPTSS